MQALHIFFIGHQFFCFHIFVPPIEKSSLNTVDRDYFFIYNVSTEPQITHIVIDFVEGLNYLQHGT